MYRALFGLLIVIAPTVAFGAEADPRALESCKKTSKDFTQIAKCLPDADVAVAVLDEFDRIYDIAAKPLKDKCVELNGGDISGASTCILSAIKDAVSLKASLPKGSTIDDPIFGAVSDDAARQKLLATQEATRGKYPDVGLWGGGLYMPYR